MLLSLWIVLALGVFAVGCGAKALRYLRMPMHVRCSGWLNNWWLNGALVPAGSAMPGITAVLTVSYAFLCRRSHRRRALLCSL